VLDAASSKVELDGTFIVFEEADVEVSRFDTAGRFKIGTTAVVTDADFGLMGDVGAAAAATYQYWWNDTTTAATLSGLRVGIDASEAATINHYEDTSLKVSVGSTLVDFATFDVSTTPDELRVNEDGADIDTVIEGANRNIAVFDASVNTMEVVGILSTEPQALTIATDAVAITSSYIVVDTEGGAATDNLATISAGAGVTLRAGMILTVRQSNDARDVTIKDGTGNIQCGADRVFTTNNGNIHLIYDGTEWLMLSFTLTN